MNTFNRVVMIVLLLVLLVLSFVTALVPFFVLDALIQFLMTTRSSLANMYHTGPFIFMIAQVGIVLALVIIFGTLLVLEIRRSKPPVVRVTTPDGKPATILVDSVAMRLRYHLDQLADVIDVRPDVKAKGDVVHVTVEVETSPDINVPMKTQEILHLIREVVEERMGLKLGRADVRIKHAPYPGDAHAPKVIDSRRE